MRAVFFLPLHGRRIRHTNASPVLQVAYNRISDSAMSACYNCCLHPIEISENPSKILGKSQFLTKYGSICFFHDNFFILKIYNCNSYLFKSTLNCLQNGIGHYCVCFILVSIKLLNRYSMGNAGV